MSVTFNEKMQNCVKRGLVGSRDPLLEFWDPPNISGTVEARNFKIGTETEGGCVLTEKYAKLRQKGSCGGNVTQFWNFGTP